MSNLIILPVAYTSEERIEARISAFRSEFLAGEHNLYNVAELIDIIIEHLQTFETDDDMLNQCYLKLNEAGFYLASSAIY